MESRGFSPPPPPPPAENKAKRNSETKQTTAAAAAAKATTEGDPTHQVATGKTKQKGSRKEIYQQLHYSKTHGSHLAAAAVADTEDAARCGFFRVSSWRPRAAASQVPKNKKCYFLASFIIDSSAWPSYSGHSIRSAKLCGPVIFQSYKFWEATS